MPRLDRRGFLTFASASAMTALNTGGLTAQNRAGRPISIDVHTHWNPEPYRKVMAELASDPLDSNPLNFDLDQRRRWMDEHGVQMHLLTLSGRMPWQWVPTDVGATLARILNDAAVQAHIAYPDRFVAGIEMSIRDPELALKELNRVAGKPGMRAVHLPNSFEGKITCLSQPMPPYWLAARSWDTRYCFIRSTATSTTTRRRDSEIPSP